MAPGTSGNPLRVAVVGSGPAGFYASEQLLKAPGLVVELEMFERLPTPWGLVRAGVAPDHPNIKSGSRASTRRRQRYRGSAFTATSTSVSTSAMRSWRAIITRSSTRSARRPTAASACPARSSRVATRRPSLSRGTTATPTTDLSCSRAVVIGNGNVALDVARMLALTSEELARSDIADHALRALADSQIEESS